jgi:hypothetical protein
VSDPRPPSAGSPQPPGATSIGGERRKNRKGLWLALAAIAAVIVLLLLLSQCGTDDESSSADPASGSAAGATSSSAESPSSSADGSSAAPSGSAGAAAGGGASAGQPGSIVTADGRSVLELTAAPDAASGLGSVSGQAVTGTAVRVLTVPADEGFWVGTADTERVWVQLTGEAGESPYQVREGDTVDFTGSVLAHDAGFAGQVGVDDAEGAAQLTSQAQHIEAPRSSVVLSE